MPADVQFNFKGPPTDLRATTAIAWSRSDAPAPEIEIKGQRYPLGFSFQRDRSVGLWSFRILENTPPGVMQGLVHLGDKTYPASVEVLEYRRIILEPRALTLEGAPGSELATTVLAKNSGNVPQKAGGSQTLKLRAAGAIARGVRKAFKETSGDLGSRLIVLGEHMSSEPWVEVKFGVRADFAKLDPGAEGHVEIRVHAPDDPHRSEEWTGNLQLFESAVSVTLKVTQKSQPPSKPRGVQN
jgi:hypothetical protein